MSKGSGRRSGTPVILWAIVCSELTANAVLLAWQASHDTPTVDEIAHLPAGVYCWQFGCFDLYHVNPPLVRMIAALPVLPCGPEISWSLRLTTPGARPEFRIGEEALRLNAPRSPRLFVLARFACIPFSLVGAWCCFCWARELYGDHAGLMAMSLWCFCPNMLAHGHLITPDVGAAAIGVLACHWYWRWLREPNWFSALLAGVGLAFAELTKFTWIVLFLVWPLVWQVWHWSHPPAERRRTWRREAVQAASILFLGLYLLNAAYGFEGSLKRLGDYDFVSPTLIGSVSDEQKGDAKSVGNRFRDTWAGAIRLPLPASYVSGIDLQKADFDRGKWSYMGGQWQFRGWWHYYLYAMSLKVPLGTWLLAALALMASFVLRGYSASRRDEIVLLAPALAVLVAVSAETGFSVHMRYVLPAFPFAFIWIAKVARAIDLRHWVIMAIGAIALTWSIASSLSIYPHSLSYFNELAGGPANGHGHLLDSNIDWGQDLFYLKRWLDEHAEASPIGLAYFGSYPAELAGIQATEVPRMPPPQRPKGTPMREASGPRPRWYAVSVNPLHGHIMGGWKVLPDYTYFLRLKPVAMAGYSIYIYYITPDDANRVRRELGMPEMNEKGQAMKEKG